MILPASYHHDWIKEKRKHYLKSDPAIMEKVIYARQQTEIIAVIGNMIKAKSLQAKWIQAN